MASDLSGRPVTKPSKRATDRAPHMGTYVRAGHMFGNRGVHLVVENQAFFIPTGDDEGDDGDPRKRATWTRDMLCIALDRLVEIEIERRGSKGKKS
jgi:hypothetical protein